MRLQDGAVLRLISSSGFCLWESFRVGLSVCLRCTVLQSLQEGREDGTGLGLISSSGFAFGNVFVFCLGILQSLDKEEGVDLRCVGVGLMSGGPAVCRQRGRCWSQMFWRWSSVWGSCSL